MLAEELKKLRKESGITQECLSNKLYVSIQTINKWENGKSLPDAINLLNIAQFYKISLDELMKNEFSSITKKRKYFNIKNFLLRFSFLHKKKVH